MLQRPGQQALAELGHLLAVAQHDRVFADEVDAADVAVEIDADAGPVEARRHLLDVRRLAGAVVPVDQDAAVIGKAREDRERGVAVEAIGLVEVRRVLARAAERRNLQVAVDAEGLPNGDRDIGPIERLTRRSV
jgi:hypothetical protein